MAEIAARLDVKVVLVPIDHFAGARFTRRTWQATLALRTTSEQVESCQHRRGHRTVENAKQCGVAMWRRLPATSKGAI